jgi:hypothetical protein
LLVIPSEARNLGRAKGRDPSPAAQDDKSIAF